MSEELPYFAVKLRELLDAKGLTPYAVAKRTGLSKQTLSVLLAGGPGPNWSTVQALAKALDVDCRVFMDPDFELPEPKPPGKPSRPRKEAETPKRPRGRPRKQDAAERKTVGAKKTQKRKGKE